MGRQRAEQRKDPQGLRRKTFGFSMVEAMLSLLIFGMIIAVFGATFPVALHAGGEGASYNQAALVAQHKIDQLRQAGYSALTLSKLSALGIVDATANSDGSYSFTNVDNLVDNGTNKGYFGAGSTGKIVIGQALSSQGGSAPSLATAEQVTVTVSWTGASLHSGSFTTHTIIAAP